MTDRESPDLRATSFGSVAEDYNRLRPRPAAQAVDWLIPARCQVAVDLGAGTGLFTSALCARVPEVIAIEPDHRMREVLSGVHPDARVVAGTGEAIPLPDRSADGVFVSSAWHWMDPQRAVPEIARVLRAAGRFGVIWTSRDRDVDWVRNLDLGGDSGRHSETDLYPPGRHHVALPDSRLFTDVAEASFSFARTMTIDDVVSMLGTYSRLIALHPDERAARLKAARVALGVRFPGAETLDVPMRSWCWRADRTK